MKIILFLIIVPFFLKAQINTESARKEFSNDIWKTEVTLDAILRGGNNEFIDGNIQIRSDLHLKNHYAFLVANTQYRDGFTKILDRRGFIHARYNYKFSDKYTIESFFQNEFNDFQKLNSRILYGLGSRLKLLDYGDDSSNTKSYVYLGNAFMLEDEILENEGKLPLITRSTNYLSVFLRISKTIDFISVTYYQFRVDEINDYRILNDTRLEFQISKHLKFISAFDYRFDNVPAFDVKKYDYELRNGIRVEF